MVHRRKSLVIVVQHEGMHVEVPASTPSGDQLFLASWLMTKRSPHTRLNYRLSIDLLFTWMRNREQPFQSVRELELLDLQAYADFLAQRYKKESTQAAKLSAVKSLWTFGFKSGIFRFNYPAMIPTPKGIDELANRILSLREVYKLIETANYLGNKRNYTLIVLLYASGIRCEEVCNLTWGYVKVKDHGGQMTVIGKGRKTRTILLHDLAYQLLEDLREELGPGLTKPDDPVFRSRQKHLVGEEYSYRMDESQIWRIVHTIGKAAGIKASTHFLRHSHATHVMHSHEVSYDVIMETLGQTDIRAFRRYLHASPEDSSSRHIKL